MGTRYLVTGGAGFIGSHLVDAIVARGDRAIVLDDFSTGRWENLDAATASGAVDVVEGSVLDRERVDECMREADFCFHLASAVGVKLIMDSPVNSLTRNVLGTEAVIASATEHGRRLLFTSSSEVYGKTDGRVLKEEADRLVGDPVKLRWSYATAKAFGEALCHSYGVERGSEAVTVRLFNTVGQRQASAYGMVLPRFARQALRDEAVTVYGDGQQFRCFTHVDDTVRALLLLAGDDGAVGGTFNVGSPAECRIMELAETVIARAGSTSSIELVPFEIAYGDGFEEPGRRRPDISAIRERVQWEPRRTIDDAIDDVIAFERARTELDVAGAAGSQLATS